MNLSKVHPRTQLVCLYTSQYKVTWFKPQDNLLKCSRKLWISKGKLVTNTQCNILTLLNWFLQQCTILHNWSTCKSSCITSKQVFTGHLLSPILLTDCSLPKSPSRRMSKKSKSGVDRQEQAGLSSLHWPLHSGEMVALCQASTALLILQSSERTTMYRPCYSILFGQSLHYVQRTNAVRHQLARAMSVSAPKKLSIVWTSSGRS